MIKTIPISSKSILRYPGGKTRAISKILPYIPEGIEELCSPFFGGGSLEIYLAARGIKVYGFDVFYPLVNFWKCACFDAESLAARVEKHLPISKTEFKFFQKHLYSFEKWEQAAVYFVLNRSSFSGSTMSGGMSLGHPRFNEAAIQRLRDFYNPNIKVLHYRFQDSIAANPNRFMYLDPPYVNSSGLYGTKGDLHKRFNHKHLARLLKRREQWILSYNDCPLVRELYQGYRFVPLNWSYGMGKNKTSNEVLILSPDI